MPARIWSTRSSLRGHQSERLAELLSALRPANAFYESRLAPLGPSFRDDFSLETFARRVPFTTKAELVADQAAHPPYGSNLTFPLARYTRCHQTSGTVGAPLRWLDTPESWDWLVQTWANVYRAAEVGNGDRVFFAFSFGPFIGFWMAFDAAERVGAMCLAGGGLSSAARLKLLMANRATVLCCTPTYALRLAEVAAEEGIALDESVVRQIIVAGEPGGSIPATRRRIEEAWHGARVFDHHGMTEVGPVTFECPAEPGVLHVMEGSFYAEIVAPSGAKTRQPNGEGELVLTPLGRTGSPLLRYRTGDLVKPRFDPATTDPPPCACGSRLLALEGGILGRVDDMVIVRGVNVFPTAVEAVLRRFAEVAEYQVVVSQASGLTAMTVRVEPTIDCGDVQDLAHRLQSVLQEAFSLRIPVKPVARGSLPRFELKAKRWHFE